jgi:hypothetical protein
MPDLFHEHVPRHGFAWEHPELVELATPVVREAPEVWDLGSGGGEMTRTLLSWGARRVVSVEKEATMVTYIRRRAHHARWGPDRFLLLGMTFEELASERNRNPAPADGAVALVSWPVNRLSHGLNILLGSWPGPVLYVGQNDGFTACGHPRLFEILRTRPILGQAELRATQQSLLYGRAPGSGFYREELHPWEADVFRSWNYLQRF